MPQESGGRATRNQPYSMLSVTGDAVLLEFDVPSTNSNTDGGHTFGPNLASNSMSSYGASASSAKFGSQEFFITDVENGNI